MNFAVPARRNETPAQRAHVLGPWLIDAAATAENVRYHLQHGAFVAVSGIRQSHTLAATTGIGGFGQPSLPGLAQPSFRPCHGNRNDQAPFPAASHL
jgi:hypothetical protein